MCRFYQIVFSGVIYCSAHQDIGRSVYILLALPFSSLGWVCAGSTRLHIEYEFFGAHKYKYTASTAIQLTGLGMCRFHQIAFSEEIYKFTASTAIQLTGLGMCRFYQIVYRVGVYIYC